VALGIGRSSRSRKTGKKEQGSGRPMKLPFVRKLTTTVSGVIPTPLAEDAGRGTRKKDQGANGERKTGGQVQDARKGSRERKEHKWKLASSE